MMFGVERGLLRISFQVFLTGQLFEDLQAADWVKLGWQQKSEETLFCQKTQMIKSLRWCYFMVCIHRGDLPKSFSCSHSMVWCSAAQTNMGYHCLGNGLGEDPQH